MHRSEANPQLARNPGPGPTQGTQLPHSDGVHRPTRPSDALALRTRYGDAGPHTLANKLAFEFGDACEDAEDQPLLSWHKTVQCFEEHCSNPQLTRVRRVFNFMPYKDRETYLRKQREFYYQRKARAQRVSPTPPVSRVSHASIPLTLLTPRVERTTVLAASHDPNRGIALRFQPAAKEMFEVDDCGNAWRIVKPDES